MMKAFKTLAAAMLVCGFLNAANGTTIARFAGSTAYRASVHAAILYALGGNGTSLTSGSFAYVGSSLATASQSIFYGTLASGSSVVIATSWTGSESGIQAVAGQINVAFLPVGTPGTAAGTQLAASGTGSDMEIPDIAMSDTLQQASAFFGYYSATGVNYPALYENKAISPVGIIPYKWVASKGADGGIVNMTSQIARTMVYNGGAPLSLFTGSNAQESVEVDLTGRNPGSGTRVAALAEVGVGSGAEVVNQVEPLDTNNALVASGTSIITSGTLWNPDTVGGISIPQGDSGYGDDSLLAAAMAAASTQTVGAIDGFPFAGYVTYLGVADADVAINAGARELSYNGVKLGTVGGNYNNDALLTEGAYTFWGYERIYYRAMNSPVAFIATAVASKIRSNTAVVFTGSMQVGRNGEGGVVGGNHF